MPFDDRDSFGAAQPLLDAAGGLGDHGVLARLDALHVDDDFSGALEAVFGAAPGEVRGVGARDQGLGGGAAVVDAGAAEGAALDDGDRAAGAGEAYGERRGGLAGADDDGVEGGHWGALL